ncbi:MAG TPA: efflux RND transporter periplasmic adaptor subunit [Steroidobacteraceae bacterium]|nr:efflux RND transporter periplasmic adaptor subunit [Steroidobacteraceae bacterium]
MHSGFKSFSKPALTLSVLAVVAATLSACGRNEAATNSAAGAPPQVTVAQVISKPVTEFDEFTGRFEAIDRVEIRPRVTGYISSVNFTEGSEVQKGDVLFVIDQRPYAAELKHAQAQLAQAKSALALAKSEKARATNLLAQHAISQEEYDTRSSGDEQAEANVQLAESALDTAALNMTYTKVTSPINGRVSRANITLGNLVNTGQTLLTTVVSLDPIYVRFDGDEQAYLRSVKAARDRVAAGSKDVAAPVLVGLADEGGFPHSGVMVFQDNEIDPQTGTIRTRAKLDNHDRAFTPGLFARVRLLGEKKYDALLINDSAVGTDQTVKYVLVVGADSKVEYRPVKLGPVIDGLRVIREGLKVDDTIVVNGLQRVRPGSPVTPQKVAMGEQHIHPGSKTMYAQTSGDQQ